jgi:hypothetical protein
MKKRGVSTALRKQHERGASCLSRVESKELRREMLSFGNYVISQFYTSRKAATVSPKTCKSP